MIKNTTLTKKVLHLAAILPALLLVSAGTTPPVLAQQAAPQIGAVVVPPLSPQVDIETARKQLRDNMDTQIAEFLKLHNDARAEVGIVGAPIVWDAQLAAYAQEWADQLAAKGGQIEHRTDTKYGENLASYTGGTGRRAVHGAKLWYDEIADYDPIANASKNGKAVGHYTQMVWRKTTKVGFGVAMAPNGTVVLCANYEIAGNMVGEHPYK